MAREGKKKLNGLKDQNGSKIKVAVLLMVNQRSQLFEPVKWQKIAVE